MKKVLSTLFLLSLIITFVSFANADHTEKVRVIKFDKEAHDLVIQRNNGDRLLLQHNRVCASMTTEFPVYLLWEDDEIAKLKVAGNEICKVYNWGEYSDDVTITERIKSPNKLEKDHLAELEWNGRKYEVDYGSGCENLKDFVGKGAYVETNRGVLDGATLYLPGNRGECKINSESFLEDVEVPETVVESPIGDIQYKAENNEVYFYWEKPEDDVKWLYLFSRSKYEIDPDDYHWRQMPYLRFSRTNSYTAKRLANDETYFFYVAARDEEGNVSPWTKMEITPVQTARSFHNNPDFENFEISVTENEDSFTLTWPDKSEDTRRYMIQLFINGKRQYLKLIDGQLNEWEISKDVADNNARFRFELRSLSKERFGKKFSDGIYWEFEDQE